MSEEDKETVPIVDKRAASKNNGSQADIPDNILDEAEPGLDVGDLETDADEPYSPEDAKEDFGNQQMPDPSFLLSMATMQMDAQQLTQALIPIFDSYAWRSMGFVADPRTGETTKDLVTAQLSIDAVAFLLGKCDSSISDIEKRDMQRRLSDLRMNFLTKKNEP